MKIPIEVLTGFVVENRIKNLLSNLRANRQAHEVCDDKGYYNVQKNT